jgi:glutamine synthetase adenylyltransferase
LRDRLSELFSICTTDALDKKRFDHLMDDLVNAISKRDHYEQALRALRPNIEDPPEKSQELCGLACLDATPRVVAEQLAQIEMERLAMIGPDEIVEMLSTSSLDNLQQV